MSIQLIPAEVAKAKETLIEAKRDGDKNASSYSRFLAKRAFGESNCAPGTSGYSAACEALREDPDRKSLTEMINLT